MKNIISFVFILFIETVFSQDTINQYGIGERILLGKNDTLSTSVKVKKGYWKEKFNDSITATGYYLPIQYEIIDTLMQLYDNTDACLYLFNVKHCFSRDGVWLYTNPKGQVINRAFYKDGKLMDSDTELSNYTDVKLLDYFIVEDIDSDYSYIKSFYSRKKGTSTKNIKRKFLIKKVYYDKNDNLIKVEYGKGKNKKTIYK